MYWDPTGHDYIQYGQTGDMIVSLQEKLISLGYDLGSYGADGVFGGATLAAVKSFQSGNGLDIDGIVGNQTWGVLNTAVALKSQDYIIRENNIAASKSANPVGEIPGYTAVVSKETFDGLIENIVEARQDGYVVKTGIEDHSWGITEKTQHVDELQVSNEIGSSSHSEVLKIANNILAGKTATLSEPSSADNINNILTVSQKLGATVPNVFVKTSSSTLKRIGKGLWDVLSLSTSEDYKAVELAEKALDSGKGIKFLTGATTVNTGKQILAGAEIVGKLGKVAGVAGLVVTPFTEVGTSNKMVETDFAEMEINEKEFGVKIPWYAYAAKYTAVYGDAASLGQVRSLAKTPTSLAKLFGASEDFGKVWENNVNAYTNIRWLTGHGPIDIK